MGVRAQFRPLLPYNRSIDAHLDNTRTLIIVNHFKSSYIVVDEHHNPSRCQSIVDANLYNRRQCDIAVNI